MTKTSVLAVAILALSALPAAAETTADNFRAETTRDFANLCSTPASSEYYTEARQFCYGYIAGATQLYFALLGPKGIDPIACPGDGVTRDQAIDVFLAWTKRHPDLLTERPIQGLMRAAVEQWPCPAGVATTKPTADKPATAKPGMAKPK
jgi:hypothetical protein